MTTWIFQGNPDYFDVDGYLGQSSDVLWTVNQGATLMKAGDEVFLWKARGSSGGHAGTVARGVLAEEPREQEDDPAARRYWKNGEGGGVFRRVRIRLAEVAGQRFLPAIYLAKKAELRELEILKVPNGTNYRTTDAQAAALASEWSTSATTSPVRLLVETLSDRVEQWRVDVEAQKASSAWATRVFQARLEASKLFQRFLEGECTVEELRSRFDRSTRLDSWESLGLSGPNGAMVLNKWVKYLPEAELTPRLIEVFSPPADEVQARTRADAFLHFLEQKIEQLQLRRSDAAMMRAVPFVSAVWQLLSFQGAGPWPTYYVSARDALLAAKVLAKSGRAVEDYLAFVGAQREMGERYGLSVDEFHKFLQWSLGTPVEPAEVSPAVEPSSSTPRVWLISPGAGAKDWSRWVEEKVATIGWNDIGDLGRFETVEEVRAALQAATGRPNPMNDQWSCFSFAHQMKEGDLVFAKKGRKQLVGYGRVSGKYRHEPTRAGDHHVLPVEWLRSEPRPLPENTILVTKTLTDVGGYPDLVRIFEEAYGEAALDSVEPSESSESDVYTVDDALRDLFLEPSTLDEMLAALREKKNLILQGPPGVGKTFVAKRLAYLLMEQKAAEQVEVVQFHQSYSYEDFVQGFRPTESGGFRREDGPFYRFCHKAKQDPHSKYVLIIDEINRGNVSRIFGELLMLLEADKRGSEWAVSLAYSKADEAPFHVPPNVYVIGTMNTADRSLALVDYALRRRFAFVDVPPGHDSEGFAKTLAERGASENLVERIRRILNTLNASIEKDPHLGEGYRVGHSYFCESRASELDHDWLDRVLRREIRPLLQEYWRDSPERLKEIEKVFEVD